MAAAWKSLGCVQQFVFYLLLNNGGVRGWQYVQWTLNQRDIVLHAFWRTHKENARLWLNQLGYTDQHIGARDSLRA